MIKTRAPGGSPIHAEPWFGSRVKLKKLSLMMLPVGTVIFHVQLLFTEKLFGKLGLVKNPLVPLRNSPVGPHTAKRVYLVSGKVDCYRAQSVSRLRFVTLSSRFIKPVSSPSPLGENDKRSIVSV